MAPPKNMIYQRCFQVPPDSPSFSTLIALVMMVINIWL
jgi:hypothetical protein